MNFFFILPVVLILFISLVFWKWFIPSKVMIRLGGKSAEKNPQWHSILSRVEEVARRQRVPLPRIWILPEFSPNVLVLRPFGSSVHLGLTEGLIRALSEKELDCALALALAHGHGWGRGFHTWVGLFFFPVASALQRYDLLTQILFAPVINSFLRTVVGPNRFFMADRVAAGFGGRWEVAAVLQKMAVMGRKLPLKTWNMSLDSLYLVSPLSLDSTPLFFFLSQPTVEKRRKYLLDAAACESASLLP